jgi:hypothetical protein
MNEDKTKILGNEEPTEELEVPKKLNTTPVLLDILAGMREGFAQVREGFAQIREDFAKMNSRMDGLEAELAGFREETAKNFRGVDRKFDVLNNQMLKIQADVLDHHDRLNDLERKAS